MPLSRKQREILEALAFLARKGERPTVREIGELVGLRSSATVQKHLRTLADAGLVELSGKSRGVRLVQGAAAPFGISAGIPIVGRIAAGEPISALEEIHQGEGSDGASSPEGGTRTEGPVSGEEFGAGFEEVPIDPGIFVQGTAPGEVVALRVHGESMVDAGILDGDLVIIRRQPAVEEGEIAAVVIDGEGTLKRWHGPTGTGARRRVRLTPENERFEPIEVAAGDHREIRVVGRYLGLIRRALR